MNLTLLRSQSVNSLSMACLHYEYSRQYGVTLIMISRPLTWFSCLHRWTGWRWRNALETTQATGEQCKT